MKNRKIPASESESPPVSEDSKAAERYVLGSTFGRRFFSAIAAKTVREVQAFQAHLRDSHFLQLSGLPLYLRTS